MQGPIPELPARKATASNTVRPYKGIDKQTVYRVASTPDEAYQGTYFEQTGTNHTHARTAIPCPDEGRNLN